MRTLSLRSTRQQHCALDPHGRLVDFFAIVLWMASLDNRPSLQVMQTSDSCPKARALDLHAPTVGSFYVVCLAYGR
jgi:hypothetical protein